MDFVLKLHKYKLEPELEAEPCMALPEHQDLSFITIINQNQVNGLEIKTRDGDWIAFDDASPSSLVVMACDGLQVWSNDRIEACKHRVIMSGSKVRYSCLVICL
ncbi:Oxoglutarate/iron-dependent dioxygenase [Parasponia andersonii]|uniref:Oxoglutarate/iron-dependent dioxygenase n=1 Tax=Parasponia andersonii TaxID=3476 RepID=A0A2P5CRC4_PARAD|nr:Oxoglutarate/iron-dependent dioxygenase [Parasponia andersonii]